MPVELRVWLRDWSGRRGICGQRFDDFVLNHETGLAATLDAARHDPATRHLLAPEILLALVALDQDPDFLRACWPDDRDVRELLALADVFGRPYTI